MEKVLILCNSPVLGTNSAFEAIRLGSGFLGLGEDIDCTLVLYGDAVLLLRNNITPDILGMDPLGEGIEMADLTELPIILVKEDLERLGISEGDLLEYESLSIIPENEVEKVIAEYPAVFHM